ncbi:MAG: hypothetical protein DWQ31_15490 [Planctomycetota bacterium]|nr:MAG: hypothetical protein DWQ31_15490 [Planctomycetota bacterium]REJ97805.1 MAG: hypothetical protein DWQ35_01290 [Planctomycetota bacterium]REK46588.1 MAG: hypothetical protein DWQ46_06870 [Planctomycetota bacterium]
MFAWCGLAANAVDATDWLRGPALRTRLESPIHLTWNRRELKEGLVGISKQLRVAVFLDRRVDPHQRIDIAAANLSVGELLKTIAAEADLGQAWIGPVLYFGPRDTARQLPEVLDRRRREVANLAAPQRRLLGRRSALTWPRLTTPTDVLREVNAAYDVRLDDSAVLPHDLWDATELPPLSFVEQVTLVTSGFDLTFQWEEPARSYRLIPFPAAAESNDVARPATEPDRRADAAASEEPEAARRDQRVADIERRRITLRVAEARLESLLAHLERQLGLQFEMAEAHDGERGDARADSAGDQDGPDSLLSQRVTLEVSEATVDEFLSQLFANTGLRFRREGLRVHVSRER